MFGKEWKPRGARAYVSDFEQTLSGEFVYIGAVYAYSAAKSKYSRSKTVGLAWLWGAAAVLLAAAEGFVPGGGMMNCPYVILPFAAEFLSACSVIWALVRLSGNRDPIREYVYTATVTALPGRALLTAILAAAAAVGEFVFNLLHPGEVTAAAWLVILLMAGTAAAALLLRRVMRGAVWELQGKE